MRNRRATMAMLLGSVWEMAGTTSGGNSATRNPHNRSVKSPASDSRTRNEIEKS